MGAILCRPPCRDVLRRNTFICSTFIYGSASLPLILYQRDDCHLCDLALAELAAARVPDFESVFIDQDQALEAEYGIRVPVLRDDATGRELDWPFDAETVVRWRGA